MTLKKTGNYLKGADDETVVVIASAPSVYAAIKQFPPEEIPTEHIYLLEFDPRFKVLAGSEHFSVYDYNKPNDIPEKLRNKCHRILIDPPFLEEECQTKSSEAARNLLVKDRSGKTKSGDDKYKLISSTGERMNELVTKKNYPDTKMTDFYPEHKNGLSNEFRCYASFECSYWKFQK
ncbi:Protein-lysine N-methyltransferase EFM5 [Candida tropicalis]